MSRIKLIFERQPLHALLLALLLAGAAAAGRIPGFRDGGMWGVATPAWFWAAVFIAVAHQTYVLFCWRFQLHGGLLTRLFGGRGFFLYAAGFSVLGIARVAVVFILAVSNRDTLPADPLPLRLLGAIVLVPALYLFYSVKRHFGFKRAFGIDHFDPDYRSRPFVRGGIFRFTRNGMYVFGFFLIWAPALWFGSTAAVIASLFNHLYIWVHYYSTELPDIKRIYGERRMSAKVSGE